MPRKKNIDRKNDVDPDDVPLGAGPMLALMREQDAIDPNLHWRTRGRTGPMSTDEEDRYAARRAWILRAARERGAIVTMKDACGMKPDLDEMEARLMSQKIRQPRTPGPNTERPAPTPGFGRDLFPGAGAEDLIPTQAEIEAEFEGYL